MLCSWPELGCLGENLLYALQLVRREVGTVEGAEAVQKLFGRACADEHARDAHVAQHPAQGHLCE